MGLAAGKSAGIWSSLSTHIFNGLAVPDRPFYGANDAAVADVYADGVLLEVPTV